MTKKSGFLFIDLTGQDQEAKPFDGLVPNDPDKPFIDMHGKVVEIKAEDIPAFVENTRAAIDATRTESGELVGLPIDAKGHDKGDAAGWITGVEQEGNVVRIIPKWTEVGMEAISKKIRRMFSPTLDLAGKVILGGTLTNWPAQRGKGGKPLLRPIEMAGTAGLFQLEDSLDEQSRKIRDAFYANVRTPEPAYAEPGAWVREVYGDYVIAEESDKLWKITFSETDDGIVFAQRSEWIEVKHAYVEAQQAQPINLPEGGNEMTVKLSELSDEDRASLVAQLAAQIKPDPANTGTPATVDLLGLTGLTEDAKKQRKAELAQIADNARKQAQLEFQADLARLQHEGKMIELAQRVTGGSDDAPRGMAVSAEELQAHLTALAPEEAKFWGDLLERTVKGGLVEFGERGHGRKREGTAPLPEWAKPFLTEFISGGGTVAEFFKLNAAELGNQADYNLVEFEQKEK